MIEKFSITLGVNLSSFLFASSEQLSKTHKGLMKISKMFMNRLLVIQQELRILKNLDFLDFANLKKIDEGSAPHISSNIILRQSTFYSLNSSRRLFGEIEELLLNNVNSIKCEVAPTIKDIKFDALEVN